MANNTATLKGKKVGLDLTQGPILKCLLLFASPIVLAALIQQLYSMVDLMIIGRFMQGTAGTIGVSTGGEMADMVTPIATAFSTAGQIYIAQLVGAKNRERLRSAMGTNITFMTLMSVVFMVITLVFSDLILNLLSCPAEGYAQAKSYMLITAIGFPFIFGYNAVCGILRGMGESRAPLVFIIIAAVSNIFMDIFLVAIIPLEAAGTAIATVIAQIASFAASFWYLYKRREQFDFELKPSYFKMDKRDVGVLCKQGIPQAIRSTLVRISIFWVNSSINSYGAVASATNGVGNKLQKFLDVFTTSLTQASAAIIGQNLGARKQDRARRCVLTTFACALSIACVIALLTWVFPTQLFAIFSQDEAVIAFGETFCHIMIFHYLWSALTSSFQSMVVGSGNATLNFVVGILDGIVCKIGLSLLFAYALNWGVTGFFTATAWSRALPGIICVVYFFSGKWKTRKLLTEK